MNVERGCALGYTAATVRRQPTRLILFVIVAIALAAACGGRTIEAGSGLDDGIGGDGAAATGGGDVGGGGMGGMTSSGTGGEGGSTSSGTGGSGGTSPLDCIGCIILNCPQTIDCITNPGCIQGVICSVTDCLGGGQPDMMCVVGCFDGDMEAAMAAIDTLMCVMGDCADQCGGMLPF